MGRFSKHLISKWNLPGFFQFLFGETISTQDSTEISRVNEVDLPRDNVDCRFEAARSEGQGSSSAVHQAVNLLKKTQSVFCRS